jgi:hypothetical protein
LGREALLRDREPEEPAAGWRPAVAWCRRRIVLQDHAHRRLVGASKDDGVVSPADARSLSGVRPSTPAAHDRSPSRSGC